MGKGKKEIIFSVTLIAIAAAFLLSVWKNSEFNSVKHYKTFTGETLFSSDGKKDRDVVVKAVPRSSTWTKVVDIEKNGLTKRNYQAYTYDFSVLNNTRDEVSDFSFKLTFSRDVFLMSAWNGSLEIHQNVDGVEVVAIVPDLREFAASDYELRTVNFDGESLIYMKPGDYLVYKPSTSQNALEVPIKPHEGTTPGFIMYVAAGESIEDSSLELAYYFHRQPSSEMLFRVAAFCLFLWFIAQIIDGIIMAQLKKYNERHERDNEIINESIETFIGFIDAKDSYTNGHSKRVAIYTKLIAAEMGYTGEELDRIYYTALLHDCGKIGVPDNILRKPSRLTDEEFDIMKSHTVHGGEILSSFKSLSHVGDGALYHHERYDGKGYPSGLAGKDIPLIARMICVADSFDAMNTNRVYRKRLTKEFIMNEIEANKGKQFDPKIADVMLKLLKEGKIPIGI